MVVLSTVAAQAFRWCWVAHSVGKHVNCIYMYYNCIARAIAFLVPTAYYKQVSTPIWRVWYYILFKHSEDLADHKDVWKTVGRDERQGVGKTLCDWG
jgi:hypothetical protein